MNETQRLRKCDERRLILQNRVIDRLRDDWLRKCLREKKKSEKSVRLWHYHYQSVLQFLTRCDKITLVRVYTIHVQITLELSMS